MATSPAASNPNDSDQTSLASKLPQKWWQWFIVYPTIGLSLISAVPNWFDRVAGYWSGVTSISAAKRENALWQKNATCVGLNSKGMLSPTKVAVDATICNSGDILVHAVTQQEKQIFKWLPLDDVVRPSGGLGSFVPTAQAATLPERIRIAGVAEPVTPKLALLDITVICTRMENGRYLHRRVNTGQGCFDEVIDTFTGALISRNAAPCVPQC